MRLLRLVGGLQVLVVDRVMLTDQCQCVLAVEVGTLTPHRLVRFRQEGDRFASTVAATLPACDSALGGLECALRFAVPARVEDTRTIGERGESFYAEIYPSFLSTRR
jgi:hypothetical protein